MTKFSETRDVLPDKLSGLIRLAIADAGRLDRDKYTPYFLDYHKPKRLWSGQSDSCCICNAGAVIAGTLGGRSDKMMAPNTPCLLYTSPSPRDS